MLQQRTAPAVVSYGRPNRRPPDTVIRIVLRGGAALQAFAKWGTSQSYRGPPRRGARRGYQYYSSCLSARARLEFLRIL